MNEQFGQESFPPAFDDGEFMDLDYVQPLSFYPNQLGDPHLQDTTSWGRTDGNIFDTQPTGEWQNESYQNQHFDFTNLPSSSVRSSQSSNARSSTSTGIFSHHSRQSSASTNTSWSHRSSTSRELNITQTARILNFNSTPIHPPPNYPAPTYETSRDQPRTVPPQNQLKPGKDQFPTCVSRTKRSRRSTKEPKYWCTSCGEGFGEKYDWKRHEVVYQEWTETYHCDNCDKVYHLDKDFIHHHQKSHRCRTCAEKQHLELARRKRKGRTGWGCGFCTKYHSDWTERCNHIAWHFEKNGDTMEKWKHSRVILSLLQQPYIWQEWMRLLDAKQETNPNFGWKKQKTGRAEGYPDSDRPPHLQDLLEFFEPGQDAAPIVKLAYNLGHRSPQSTPKNSHRDHWAKGSSSSSSTPTKITPSPPRLDKELPLAPGAPPALPLRDLQEFGLGATSVSYEDGFPQWNRFINTIPEDPNLPDTLPIDLSGLHQDPLHEGLGRPYSHN